MIKSGPVAWHDGRPIAEVKAGGCLLTTSPSPGYERIAGDLLRLPVADPAALLAAIGGGATATQPIVTREMLSNIPNRPGTRGEIAYKWCPLCESASEGDWTHFSMRGDLWSCMRCARGGRVTDAPRTTFSLTRLSDIKTKSIRWAVDGLLEADSLAQFYGGSGEFKTFVVADISACIGTGTPYHGRKVLPGGVVFVLGEGQAGIKRRFLAWEKHSGVSLSDASIFVSDEPFIGSDLDTDGYFNAVAGVIESADVHPLQLVVIDTLSRNFGTGDENSNTDMATFVRGCDRLRRRFKCLVLVVHHTGHVQQQRSRGASAWRAALDAEYHVIAQGDGTVTATCTKMKDAEPPKPLLFTIKTINLGIDAEGKPINSLVLVDGSATEENRIQNTQKRLDAEITSVVEIVRRNPGKSVRALEKMAHSELHLSRGVVRRVLACAESKGLLTVFHGGTNAKMYQANEVRRSAPKCADGALPHTPREVRRVRQHPCKGLAPAHSRRRAAKHDNKGGKK